MDSLSWSSRGSNYNGVRERITLFCPLFFLPRSPLGLQGVAIFIETTGCNELTSHSNNHNNGCGLYCHGL